MLRTSPPFPVVEKEAHLSVFSVTDKENSVPVRVIFDESFHKTRERKRRQRERLRQKETERDRKRQKETDTGKHTERKWHRDT